MNVLLIVVGIIFVVSAVIGYRKGFIKIVASLAATILSIVLVMALLPTVSQFLLKTFPIEKAVQEKCSELISSESGADASKDAQISAIENSKLPDTLQQLLLANNNQEIYNSLGVSTFSGYVASYLASLLANIIAFILLEIVISILVRLAMRALKVIDKIPLVGTVNRVAGGALGLANGLIVVWVIFLLITLMYSSEFGKTCYENIMSNSFLKTIYDKNILMNYITKFIG